MVIWNGLELCEMKSSWEYFAILQSEKIDLFAILKSHLLEKCFYMSIPNEYVIVYLDNSHEIFSRGIRGEYKASS